VYSTVAPTALPDIVADDRIAIVGMAGDGKTYAAKRLVERVLGRRAPD